MIEEKEMAFLEELKKYENRWVAVLESEDEEIIVGSGEDAVEAKSDAVARGFSDVVLFWVRPFGAGRIN